MNNRRSFFSTAVAFFTGTAILAKEPVKRPSLSDKIKENINSPLNLVKEKRLINVDRWEWNGENYPNIETTSKTPIMDEVRKHETLSPEQLSKLLSEANSKKI